MMNPVTFSGAIRTPNVLQILVDVDLGSNDPVFGSDRVMKSPPIIRAILGVVTRTPALAAIPLGLAFAAALSVSRTRLAASQTALIRACGEPVPAFAAHFAPDWLLRFGAMLGQVTGEVAIEAPAALLEVPRPRTSPG